MLFFSSRITGGIESFQSAIIDFTVTGVTNITTVPSGKVYAVQFIFDRTDTITTPGTAHTYKIITDGAAEIMAPQISISNAVDEFTRRQATYNTLILATEIIQVEVTIASTAATHTGRVIVAVEILAA